VESFQGGVKEAETKTIPGLPSRDEDYTFACFGTSIVGLD
jgi:hypothetical protein